MRERLADLLVEVTTQLGREPDDATMLGLLIDSCTELLEATATGLMVADPRGRLEVVAASDEPSRFLELLQVQAAQGPCVESVHSREVVAVADLRADSQRWPDFAAAAERAGFRAVHAIPLRLDTHAVGGLNVFHAEPTQLARWQLNAGQAFADLAVQGLTTERVTRRGERLAERTVAVLNDRIHLAQAIGIVAATRRLDPDDARSLIRCHAREHGWSLYELAHALTSGALDPAELTGAHTPEADAATAGPAGSRSGEAGFSPEP